MKCNLNPEYRPLHPALSTIERTACRVLGGLNAGAAGREALRELVVEDVASDVFVDDEEEDE